MSRVTHDFSQEYVLLRLSHSRPQTTSLDLFIEGSVALSLPQATLAFRLTEEIAVDNQWNYLF